LKPGITFGVTVVCLVLLWAGVSYLNDSIAPLFLNSRIERLGERNLPRVSVEKGAMVYCRMKADDFRFPLPPGSQATNLVINSGGFDTVHGSLEVRFGNSLPMTADAYRAWLSGKAKIGGSVAVEPIPNGLLVKFDYFGDK
jgi:hypothetical protein